jgi:hypothetical protein
VLSTDQVPAKLEEIRNRSMWSEGTADSCNWGKLVWQDQLDYWQNDSLNIPVTQSDGRITPVAVNVNNSVEELLK